MLDGGRGERPSGTGDALGQPICDLEQPEAGEVRRAPEPHPAPMFSQDGDNNAVFKFKKRGRWHRR